MKIFSLKLPEELHMKLKIAATQSGQTMMEWIIEAIEQKLKKGGK